VFELLTSGRSPRRLQPERLQRLTRPRPGL